MLYKTYNNFSYEMLNFGISYNILDLSQTLNILLISLKFLPMFVKIYLVQGERVDGKK